MVIQRTDSVDGKVGAFLSRNTDQALEQARASDKRRKQGNVLSPIDGIPVSMKDVIATKGQPLTCGSRILEKFVSPYDSTCTQKLKAAGAVLWGRLNMDEFAMGSSTENSAYKITGNPWNTDCVAGGSSGGSAATVSAGETILSLGSDTGGSIRQPASFCGIAGMKPTYGLISRYGLVAYASSLDQIGPLGRTVEDISLLLSVIAGYDERDSTSFKIEIPHYHAALKNPDKPFRLGIPGEYFGDGLNSEVRASVEKVIEFYRQSGCEVNPVTLPHTELAIPVYYIIATAEASSNLARFDGVRYTHRSERTEDAIDMYFKSRGEGFGEEVKRRIILGTYVLSSGYYDAWYLRAQKVRTLIRQDFLNAFEKVDAIIAPTAPTVSFKKGEKADDPLAMYLSDIYTISVNLAGLPGISVPCGFSQSGLPIGFQLVGKPYQESELLQIAHRYDRTHQYGLKIPPL